MNLILEVILCPWMKPNRETIVKVQGVEVQVEGAGVVGLGEEVAVAAEADSVEGMAVAEVVVEEVVVGVVDSQVDQALLQKV